MIEKPLILSRRNVDTMYSGVVNGDFINNNSNIYSFLVRHLLLLEFTCNISRVKKIVTFGKASFFGGNCCFVNPMAFLTFLMGFLLTHYMWG